MCCFSAVKHELNQNLQLVNYNIESYNPHLPPPYSVKVEYEKGEREELYRGIRDESGDFFFKTDYSSILGNGTSS